MSWCWWALTPERPGDATAAAPLSAPDGAPAGWLAAWDRHARPRRDALRGDRRLLAPDGAAGWISLVLPPPGARLLFDDLAVQQARRDVLARPPMRDALREDGLSGFGATDHLRDPNAELPPTDP